jgi:hypothetical protein
MAAGLRTLHHQDIDACRDLTHCMLFRADKGRHGHALLPAHVDHFLRWDTERVSDKPDRVAEGDLEKSQGSFRIERLRLVVGDACRREFDTVLVQEIAGEIAMLLRDASLQAPPGDVLLSGGGNIFGNENVNPIRFSIDVAVNPFQLVFQRFRRMRRRSEDAEAARPAHGGNHVAAVAKGEQGKVNSQHVTDRRFHSYFSRQQVRRALELGRRTLAHRPDDSQARLGFVILCARAAERMRFATFPPSSDRNRSPQSWFFWDGRGLRVSSRSSAYRGRH